MMSQFQPHWDLYPKSYLAPKIEFPLIDHIDGDLNKEVWSNVPWSDAFDDIRGSEDAPKDDRPRPTCQTRFKAMWDDTHLYIGALLESDFETQAHFTERNSPIYQKDSDFEVFLDPHGCCQDYKELEVNAINTVWNLLLDRPYDDGGSEHSGRIAKPGDSNYYEVYQQKTATRIVAGQLNNPNMGATWSVEMALSYSDILANMTDRAGCDRRSLPKIGSMWRINFSRVEHQGDINWTWQPQIVWDANRQRYSGYVAMHLPDAWGYIVFGDQSKDSKRETSLLAESRDPTWPVRLAAMNIYYAQHAFQKKNQSFASKMGQLKDFVDPKIVDPFRIEIQPSTSGSDVIDEFVAIVADGLDGPVASVTQDRYLCVEKTSSTSLSST